MLKPARKSGSRMQALLHRLVRRIEAALLEIDGGEAEVKIGRIGLPLHGLRKCVLCRRQIARLQLRPAQNAKRNRHRWHRDQRPVALASAPSAPSPDAQRKIGVLLIGQGDRRGQGNCLFISAVGQPDFFWCRFNCLLGIDGGKLGMQDGISGAQGNGLRASPSQLAQSGLIGRRLGPQRHGRRRDGVGGQRPFHIQPTLLQDSPGQRLCAPPTV